MRIPRSWLLEFLASDYSVEDLFPLLTMGIAEVSAVEEPDDDEVMVLELKPDRGDCLSVEGLAREIAALAPDRLMAPPGLEKATDEAAGHDPGSTAAPLNIRIDAPDLCSRYVGIVVDGVQVGPSPPWLEKRILQLGLRTVNNVVDATAYVMYEIGQPLHAFDLELLDGPEITVRLAAEGEKLVAINGQQYALEPTNLVIADRSRPVAIAGVMGGLESEVTQKTARILIESAWFDPISVRLTSRGLGLTTDASQRFERSVDPRGCLRAALRAAMLICEVAGGRIDGGPTDVRVTLPPDATILLRPGRVEKILGMSMTPDEIRETLERLGLTVAPKGDVFRVTVPPRRPDLQIEEDLIEEVARVAGYERIPMTMPTGRDTPGGPTPVLRMADLIRDTLVDQGYSEIRSYSLTSPEALHRAGETRETAAIRNPMSTDRVALRPAVLPNLLETAEANLGHGFRNLHLFEIGRVFHPRAGEPMPAESTSLAGLAMGSAWRSGWNLPEPGLASDFFAVKGVLENLGAALRLTLRFTPSSLHAAMHPGRCAAVSIEGGDEIGFVGELHPEISERYGLPNRPVSFEISVDSLFKVHQEQVHRPINAAIFHQPPATRDLAIVVSRSVSFADLVQVLRSSSTMVTDARLFDLYQGPGIAEDEQSVAVALVLRAPGRTLTDDEANTEVSRIVEVLSDRFGARRR